MGAIVLYAYFVRIIPASSSEPLSPVFLWSLGILSVVELAVGQAVRSKFIQPAFETLRTKPDDVTSLNRWRMGVIVSDCLAMSVVLYGLMIHLLGGTDRQVAPFLAAGAVAMLFWWPKQP
jgi:hypothetical protein